jgi:hypothetical protein
VHEQGVKTDKMPEAKHLSHDEVWSFELSKKTQANPA